MESPAFTYTTYIGATPEQVWRALTESEFTERYWGLEVESDWHAGSVWKLRQWGIEIADDEQVVLESEPFQRLSYGWHAFTPEWRRLAQEKVGFDPAFLERIAAEPRSRATFEIHDLGAGLVVLSLTHDRFQDGSEVLPTISQGWPYILSNLKTLLETGEALPTPAPDGSAAG